MLNYQSAYPINQYTLIPNEAREELSQSAYFLYSVLLSLTKNEDNSDEALMKKGKFKRKETLNKYKRELINKSYLEIKRVYSNKRALYIGKEMVKKYKKYFKKSECVLIQNDLDNLYFGSTK